MLEGGKAGQARCQPASCPQSSQHTKGAVQSNQVPLELNQSDRYRMIGGSNGERGGAGARQRSNALPPAGAPPPPALTAAWPWPWQRRAPAPQTAPRRRPSAGMRARRRGTARPPPQTPVTSRACGAVPGLWRRWTLRQQDRRGAVRQSARHNWCLGDGAGARLAGKAASSYCGSHMPATLCPKRPKHSAHLRPPRRRGRWRGRTGCRCTAARCPGGWSRILLPRIRRASTMR